MRVVLFLIAVASVTSIASGAEIGPWPAGTVYMWETQPIAGYASGDVSFNPPDPVLLMPATSTPLKISWLPYPPSSNVSERYAAAKLLMPAGKAMKSLHVKVYDPAGTSGRTGWAVIIKDAAGKTMDFGVRPQNREGITPPPTSYGPAKIAAREYDGLTGYTEATWTRDGLSYPYMTRTRTGNNYYTIDFTRNVDRTLSWTLAAWENTVTWTATGTGTVAYGSGDPADDITEVYLSTAMSETTSTVNYKWTEFLFVSGTPDPCPAPTVASIGTLEGIAGTTLYDVNVAGAGFVAGETGIALRKTGSTARFGATNVRVAEGGASLLCDIAVPADAAAGDWDVVVTTWCGEGTLSPAFTVVCNTPTVTSVTDSLGGPANGTRGLTATGVKLAGANFVAGDTTVKLRWPFGGQGDISATNVVVSDANNLTCDIALSPTSIYVGTYDVVVRTCAEATASGSFEVLCNVPIPTDISPTEGYLGDSFVLTINGSNFVRTQTSVVLRIPGLGDIDTLNETVNSAGTQITCDLYLPEYAAAGKWDVVVTTCYSGTLTQAFEIKPLCVAPTVAAISPSTGVQDRSNTRLHPPYDGVAVPSAPVSATITGTDFAADATVKLAKPGSPDIAATNVVVDTSATPNTITCDIDLRGATPGALDGAWDVVVTTCAAGSLPGGFTVSTCFAPAQDTDGDGDVDLADFSVFQNCFNGPNRPYKLPAGFNKDCYCLDTGDNPVVDDVDLADFNTFQGCFNGPNRPPKAGC